MRLAATAVALVLGAAACSTSDDPKPRAAGGDDPVFLGVRSSAPTLLQEDRSCDAVLDDFQTFAGEVFEGGFAVADAGFGSIALEESGDRVVAAPASGAATAGDGDDTAASAPSGLAQTGDNSSTTNTQEEGIDEPDVVENDGEFVYLVDQAERSELVILDGATAEVLSRTELASYGTQLLLSGDRLLAISGGGGHGGFPIAVDVARPAPADAAIDAELDAAAEADALVGPTPDDVEGPVEEPSAEPPVEDPVPVPEPLPVDPPTFAAGTIIQLIDVSDRTAPEILETTELEGNHVDTRVVDGVARVVISSFPQPQILFEPPIRGDGTINIDAFDDRLQETTIEEWLPQFRTTDAASSSSIEGQLVACEDVLVPEVNAGVTETSVLRVDFEDGFDPADTTTIVAEAGTVYTSSSTLYIAANRYVTPDQQAGIGPEDWSTAIHAFDLGGDGAAAHLGAGEVPGSTLNQFSLSEFDGHLRIATTEGTPWGAVESESGVRVLRLEGGALVEVGAVTGLGKTETIQSVRFMGPVGYVVTFRQTDPLFVIDLSDPTAPESVGELKIPGFSSYLHPIGEGRLVGVGRDADLDGRDRGFLLSLFDVSDPTAPTQLQTWTMENAWSQAGNDPQAFLWWGPESAAILPMERFTEPSPNDPTLEVGHGSVMTVFDVDDAGITERAAVGADGRWASRAIVVQGRLWSLFDGAVVVSDFDGTDRAQTTYR